jgi:arsenate reductase
MLITLYGIPNCDTVKKAKLWLTAQRLEFVFHDFKKQGLQRATVTQWLTQLSPDVLVNRKGTTWRNLPDERRAAIIGADSADRATDLGTDLATELTTNMATELATDLATELATALMLASPSIVKRPVLRITEQRNDSLHDTFHVGFSDARYRQIFSIQDEPSP